MRFTFLNNYTYLSLFLILLPTFLWAEGSADPHIYIKKIQVQGTKKTKDYILLREMNIRIGDSIAVAEIGQLLEENRKRIMNTGLFTRIKINVKDWQPPDNHVTLEIEAAENWYIYPIPIFELADRNFNVWWVEQERSLQRINFGVRLVYRNVTGHNDLLKAKVQSGYTNKLELDYGFPFINQKETIGLSGNALYTRNKEIIRNTVQNKPDFYRDDDNFLFRRLRFGLTLSYRPFLKAFNYFTLRFHRQNITEGVAIPELNPDYFLDERREQRYFAFHYQFAHDNRDIIAYPLRGNYFSVDFLQEGLGIFKERNFTALAPKYAQYFRLNRRLSVEMIGKVRWVISEEQPAYYNNRGLGYEPDFIRAYEYYVIDGQDYGYLKTSGRYEFYDGIVDYGKAMPLEFLRTMPLRVYGKLNFDTGYVRELYYAENNPFANRMLYGGGIGLDFVIYYDKVIQIEYSMNHLGERGVFLHLKLF
ncbi:MAG: POTRA domain-containing protein [Saprospiraceae bacterium]